MSLHYPSQDTRVLFGSKTAAGVRTGVALTSAYQAESAGVPTKSFEAAGYSTAVFHVNYTMGATETSNSIELKIEESADGINYYRIPNDAASGGTSTLTAREFTFVGTNAAAATISILLNVAYPFMRVSAKETGVVTNAGDAFVEVTLSGK
jgi:hypothetical protein